MAGWATFVCAAAAVILLWRIDRRLLKIEVNWEWAAAAMKKYGLLVPPAGAGERKPPREG